MCVIKCGLRPEKITTGASPGTFFTVSGTARMVPAEDLNVHIGTKQRGVETCLQDIVTKVPGLAPILIVKCTKIVSCCGKVAFANVFEASFLLEFGFLMQFRKSGLHNTCDKEW